MLQVEKYNIRIVNIGDKYGRDDCLTKMSVVRMLLSSTSTMRRVLRLMLCSSGVR